MIIKLVQSGGIISIIKEASSKVNWTKEECDIMLKKIAVTNGAGNRQVRDGINYTLEIDGEEMSVDINKADGKFLEVFKKLKSHLKIIKT